MRPTPTLTGEATTTAPRRPGTWGSTLFGVAYGDAHGYPTEFTTYQALVDRHGPQGPDTPDPLVISDDTQMTLALARALERADLADAAQVRSTIVDEYLAWLRDPDNDRAPGSTCLRALYDLEALTQAPTPDVGGGDGLPHGWVRATVPDSKGCGANMRVAPAAFLPNTLWQPVAAYQAVITHGHPTAATSALMTACLVRLAAIGTPPRDLLGAAVTIATTQADLPAPTWAEQWLPGLPEHTGFPDMHAYFQAGWKEVRDALILAEQGLAAFRYDPWDGDVCDYAGQGWVADEALGAALVCVSLFPDDPELVVRRAAMTGGDSDSIGAIAGALIGASDPEAWDPDWTGRLERRYADELGRLAGSPPG